MYLVYHPTTNICFISRRESHLTLTLDGYSVDLHVRPSYLGYESINVTQINQLVGPLQQLQCKLQTDRLEPMISGCKCLMYCQCSFISYIIPD